MDEHMNTTRRCSDGNIENLSPNSRRKYVPPPPCSNPFSTRKSADWSTKNTNSRSNVDVCGSRRQQTELTIVVMGSPRVGKSAIVNQFLHGVFQSDYKETLDDMHWIEYDAMARPPETTLTQSKNNSETRRNRNRQDSINSQVGIFLLKIIDASGSREFIGMRKLYEQQGDAFILIVSIDDRGSFDEAKVIRREIDECNCKNAPVIVVLNKIDLRDETEQNSNTRICVLVDEVEKFASSTHSLFAESTAMKYESVNEIFQRLLQYHSSVPSAAELKYRRKSMPVAMSGSELASLRNSALDKTSSKASSRPRLSTISDHKKSIQEMSEEEVDEPKAVEKRSSCVLS